MEWYSDYNQVQQVTGSLGAIQPPDQGIKNSQIAIHPVNKIIQGDWNWQYNRNMSVQPALWHNYNNRKEAMLFGDAHVDFFQFPVNITESDDTTPDPDYVFW